MYYYCYSLKRNSKARRNSASMSILSPSWFGSEMHKPSFHISEREPRGFIWKKVELHHEHLTSGVKNALQSIRNSEGKTDESANASGTEDDTVVGVSVFMVSINDAQSHRYETCNSFVKYMQLRAADERLDSQPQAQVTHMHMHVRRSPRAL